MDTRCFDQFARFTGRDLMVRWHRDEIGAELGECQFQLHHRGDTVHRTAAALLDRQTR